MKRGYYRVVRLMIAGLVVVVLQAQDSSTIRVPVRLVSVPTLVFTARGRIASGLEARDFTVLDNGVKQRIQLQDSNSRPSVAIVVQANDGAASYLESVKRARALIDSLLIGEGGRSAIVTSGESVDLIKPFDDPDCCTALSKLRGHGSDARMMDGGMEAVRLLSREEQSRPRILLLVGQSADKGSETTIESLKERAARENVTIHSLTWPIADKKFVAETFSLNGKDGSGFVAQADLMKLVPALRSGAKRAVKSDPFSILASATGGTQSGFRKQAQLEDALIALGTAIRSSYLLLYTPTSSDPGYHRLSVAVDLQGDRVYSRPGYWSN